MRVVREQHQRGQARRPDGIALRYRLGRVAHGVQRIGDVAHLAREPGHLGDAAGVVRDRAVGIQRHDHAGHRQHGRGGNGDAVQADVVQLPELEGSPDRQTHRDHRQRRGLHRHAEACDDVGGMTGLRGGGDSAHQA